MYSFKKKGSRQLITSQGMMQREDFRAVSSMVTKELLKSKTKRTNYEKSFGI